MHTTSVRPIIPPHYHYDNSLPVSQPVYHNFDDDIQHRYPTYDPITGEHMTSGQVINTRLIAGGQYIRERRPILCCKFCQKKVPVNCLTISLMSSLMLLMMFSFIYLLVDTNNKSAVNTAVLEEVIWFLVFNVIWISIIIIIRYSYANRDNLLSLKCLNSNEDEERSVSFDYNYNSNQCNEQFVWIIPVLI